MADQSRQRERMWLSALREIGQHFAKIGDIIMKCAEDTENVTTRPYAKSTERGREELRLHKRKSTEDPRTTYKPAERDTARYPPSAEGRPGPSSYSRSKYASKDTARDFPKPVSRNGRVGMAQVEEEEEEEEDDDDEMLSERFRGRKRSAPGDRLSFEERRRDSGHYPISRRPSRPMKRVRMNWTDAENATFFDTIRRFATEDDNSVLHKIVSALGGSRTLIQCKGHFRNLLVVGKVVQSDTEPRRWIVVDDPPEQRRSGLGGKTLHTDSKNSRSSGVSREDPPTENRARDEADDDRLKGSRNDDRGQSSHQDDKPIDDDDDVVLENIEDDDERDKDYQDDEAMEEDDDEEENESGTNNTAVRVADVGDIDPGGTGGDYGNPSMGSSVRNIDDGTGKTSSMPLKKQPSGRVGEVAAIQSLHDKKDLH